MLNTMHRQHSTTPAALRLALLSTLLLSVVLATPAQADTVGLRLSPRGQVITANKDEPASLRFNLARYDSSFLDINLTPTPPLQLGLASSNQSARNNALSADWFPFDSGLRTSAGLTWGDRRNSAGLFDSAQDDALRSRAFLGLGWTTSASSASSGTSWRIDADVGASLTSPRDCVTSASNCLGLGSAGLKPNASSDGIRWNPFIRIGATFQY